MLSTSDPVYQALLGAFKEKIRIIPGVFAGFDPARLLDHSAFVVLSKGIRDHNFKCRTLKDLSLDDTGIKGVSFKDQVNKIIDYDRRIPITKLIIDMTSNQTAIFDMLHDYFGTRIEGVVFTKPIKSELIQTTRLVFQEKLIEFNPEVTYFPVLRKELYQLNTETLKHPEKGTDDFVWALSLAIKATNVVSYKSRVESGYYSGELLF